jgi:hypothetical protein
MYLGANAVYAQSDCEEYQLFIKSTLIIPNFNEEGVGTTVGSTSDTSASEAAASLSNGVKYPIREIINRIVAYFVRHSPSRYFKPLSIVLNLILTYKHIYKAAKNKIYSVLGIDIE